MAFQLAEWLRMEGGPLGVISKCIYPWKSSYIFYKETPEQVQKLSGVLFGMHIKTFIGFAAAA